jgi:heme oxygenase
VIARSALRTATADAHERVDEIFSRFRLAEASGYRAFLRATASAHLPAEAGLEAAGAARVLEDWPQRRRADFIRRDLADLGDMPPERTQSHAFPSDAAILGGIYVLEGSRLGGAVLRREVPSDLPNSFLAAPSPPGSWRNLTQLLDRHLSDRQRLGEAILAARQLFASFAAAGLAELEPAQ